MIAEIDNFLEEKGRDISWIVEASKQVAKLSMTSHPSKLSHPEAKTTAIIANCLYKNDGYLRTGNVHFQLDELDVTGNAAYMGAYKFLLLKLANGKSILENLEADYELLKVYFAKNLIDFESIKQNFLLIKSSNNINKTNPLVKQVYFPIDDSQEYHLLSILTSSKMLGEIKLRINNLRFSDEAKEAKKCKEKEKYHPTGYADIYKLTKIGFGGSKPQNISFLNSKSGGQFYLLSSIPPVLTKRSVRLPRTDFFAQCLYRKDFNNSFELLHKLMQLDINNERIRTSITNIIRFIIDQILRAVNSIREQERGWSQTPYYINLPKEQKVWLDSSNQQDGDLYPEWRDEISLRISSWIVLTYEKVIHKAYKLGDEELLKIRNMVEEVLDKDKENF